MYTHFTRGSRGYFLLGKGGPGGMYDKIELLVPIADRDYSVRLEEGTDKIDYDYRFISRVGNFIRRDYMNGYSILRGSLAKFYHGENMTPLSFGEVSKALDKLGEAFTLKLDNAKVLSLEFGSSFMVKKPACEYLQLLGNCKYFKRMDFKNQTGKLESVTYSKRKGRNKFIAYDKVAEMNKNRKQPGVIDAFKFIAFNKNIEMKDKRHRCIPDLYKRTDVLRLEYAIKEGRIREIFRNDLTAYDLATSKVYHKLQQQFCEFYKNISKTGRSVFINPVYMGKRTSTQFQKLVLEQLRQLCPNEYDFMLQGAQARELLPSYTLNRIRAGDRVNSQDYNISYANELIAELNALVKLKMGKIA